MSAQIPSRLLVITDLWPTMRHPGLASWIVEPVQRMLDRGVDTRVIVLRREFPPSRLVSSIGSPRRARAEWREWREDLGASLLHPEAATAVRYTSPPRPWAHDAWGSWAWAMRRGRLLEFAKEAAPDLVVGHFAVPAGDVAVRLARRLGVPAAVHVHGSDLAYTAGRTARGRVRVASVLSSAGLVVANSGSTSAAIAELGVSRDLVTLWQGGDVTTAEDSIVAGTGLRVLSVGGLGADKGWSDSIGILKALRERGVGITWTIAGSGTRDQAGAVMNAVSDAGLSDVTDYRGEVPHGEVAALMASSDVFLLPSQKDAYGVVYAEALGAGLLVVGGARAGAIADFADAGAPVIEVSPGGTDPAAEQLRLLAANPARLRTVRVAGLRWAGEHLGWERYVDALMGEYAKTLTGPRS